MSDKPQVDKFRDLARELEADEDEGRFEETVRKIAPGQPFWRVEFLKVGHGQHAVHHPAAGQRPEPSSPPFATPQEAYGWLAQRGCVQSEDDPDKWLQR